MTRNGIPAALLLLACSTRAPASDVSALARPAGGPPGATANGKSFLGSLVGGSNSPTPTCFSAEGRFVAFVSWANDLVLGLVQNTLSSVYVTDLTTGATTLVSHAAANPLATADRDASSPAISADGRWVAYVSAATNLVPGQTSGGGVANVFLFDRLGGGNVMVTRRGASFPLTGGDADSFAPLISADGRFVAFLSKATNLAPGQVQRHDASGSDLFLYDRDLGTTTLVTHQDGFPERTGNDTTFWHAMSAGGRFLAFASLASDLVPGQVDGPGTADVFLFDRTTAATTLVSRAAGSSATAGNGASTLPTISADGRFIAFESAANDLVAGMADADGAAPDVFLFDRVGGTAVLVSHAPGFPLTTADQGAGGPRLSADGSAVAYRSLSTNLVPGQVDQNGAADVFAYDRPSGTNTLVSRNAFFNLRTGNADSTSPEISADGSRIVFTSRATDLVQGQLDTNAGDDVFLHDRNTGKNVLASRTPASPAVTGGAASAGALLSPDGNLVAFNSESANLVASDANSLMDAFLFRPVSFGSATTFTPLTPCRLVDTRAAGEALPGGSRTDFTLSGLCGVPSDASAVSLNVTVTRPEAPGYVDVYPAGLAVPPTGILSFSAGQTRPNNAIVSVGGTPAGTVTVRNASAGTAHVVLDVNGFFR